MNVFLEIIYKGICLSKDRDNMSVVSVKKKDLNKRGIVDFKEWKARKDSVYIGRNMSYQVPGAEGSKWGNPYPTSKFTLEKSLELYKDYIINEPNLCNSLKELKGKELGCWCKPAKCHGDVLLQLLEDLHDCGSSDVLIEEDGE